MTSIFDKTFFYRFLSALVLSALVLVPEIAFAQSQALENTIKNGLCVVIKALTGEVGKALATLAILFLGIGAFFGKVNWGLALMFAAGIVAIFGAASIASGFTSGGNVSCP